MKTFYAAMALSTLILNVCLTIYIAGSLKNSTKAARAAQPVTIFQLNTPENQDTTEVVRNP